MLTTNGTEKELLQEIVHLRLRLEEAEDTLRAIGAGEVDAFVVSSPAGKQVYTLKGAEHIYRVLVETMNEGAATLSPDGTILYCNNSLAAMLQVPLESLIGAQLVSYVAPVDRPFFTAGLSRSTVERTQDEIAMITGKGEAVPVLISYGILDLSESRILSVVITDITQQKRNEEYLAAEKLARSIIDQAGEVIIVCDERGRIIRASKLAHQLRNMNPLLKRFDTFIQLRETGTGERVSLDPSLPSEYKSVEVEFKNHDDQIMYFLLNAAPLKGGSGQVIGFITTLTDITEKKILRDRLLAMNEELERRVEQRTHELQEKHLQYLHAEKLSAMGQFSASIAHEFSNPLQGIMAILKGLKKMEALGEEDREMLDTAISESERMKNLIRNLQEFNRPSLDKKVEVDINESIDSLLMLCRSDFKRKKIRIELRYSYDLPEIMAIPDQIKQVFLNLLTNAADACAGGGGQITISTWQTEKCVGVAIEDNGVGIEPDHLDLIFQAFYTTKAEDLRGTGLGLSVCQGIVQKHHGEIRAASQPGKGSTFTVLLPIKADDGQCQ